MQVLISVLRLGVMSDLSRTLQGVREKVFRLSDSQSSHRTRASSTLFLPLC